MILHISNEGSINQLDPRRGEDKRRVQLYSDRKQRVDGDIDAMEAVVTGIVALVKGKAHLVEGTPLMPDGVIMYASAGLCLYFLAGHLKPKCPRKKEASG